MIDEMARSGVPPANPFFGGAGTPARLAYYYLWHFSAAELSLLAGISGWEADAALTWFTCFRFARFDDRLGGLVFRPRRQQLLG